MQNLSGSVPANLTFPTKNGIPLNFGKTVFNASDEVEQNTEEVLVDEGSQLNAESGDGSDGG